MAGSDKIDPANPCLGCGAALTHAWQRLQILAERLCNFFEMPVREPRGARTPAVGEHGRGGDPEW